MATSTIPELRAALDAAATDSERLSATQALAKELLNVDPREGLSLAREGLELAERLNNEHAVARALRQMGMMQIQLSDNHKALEQLNRASLKYEKLGDRSGVANTLNSWGLAYWSLSEFTRALEKFESAILLFEELGERSGTAYTMMNIGGVYSDLGEGGKALERYQSALAIAEELDNRDAIAGITGNMGVVFTGLGENARALEYHQLALSLYQELGNRTDTAVAIGNIGLVYSALGEYAEAMEQFKSALVHFEELGDRSNAINQIGNIGNTYTYLREYHNALAQYRLGLALAEEVDARDKVCWIFGLLGCIYLEKECEEYNPDIAEGYFLQGITLSTELGVKSRECEFHQQLATLYKEQGRWQEAHEHLSHSHKLKEELNTAEAHKKAEQIEHMKQIAELEKRRALERAEEEAAREALGLRAQLLEVQLDRQRAELASQAMHLARQTEMLGVFRNDLRMIMREGGDPLATVKQIREKLKELPCEAIDWTKFDAEFRQTYPEFQTKLLQRYPELSGMEMKVCALLKLKLTSADIAKLLCLSDRSVEGHRLRIRRKMGLTPGEDLHTILADI